MRPQVKALEIAEAKSPRMHKNPLFCKHRRYKSKKEKNSVTTLKCTELKKYFLSAVVAIETLLRRKRPQQRKQHT